MEPERSDAAGAAGADAGLSWSLAGWRMACTLGLITLVLGLVVIFRPAQSLSVIAVLLGVAMIVSGVFHVVRSLAGRENERVWRGIIGALSILAGLLLVRHLHLTVALIGVFIGFTWVIQGVGWLAEGLSGGRGRGGRGWPLFFGVISLIAGIVVISTPIASVGALTVFLGAWLIVIGALEVYGGLLLRRSGSGRETGPGTRPGGRPGVPGQRPGTSGRTAATGPDASARARRVRP